MGRGLCWQCRIPRKLKWLAVKMAIRLRDSGRFMQSLSYEAGKLTQRWFLQLFNWHLVCWSTAISVQGSVVMTTTGSTSVIKACFLRFFFFLYHIRRSRQKMYVDWAAQILFQRKKITAVHILPFHRGIKRSLVYSTSLGQHPTVFWAAHAVQRVGKLSWSPPNNLIIPVVCMIQTVSAVQHRYWAVWFTFILNDMPKVRSSHISHTCQLMSRNIFTAAH